VAFEIETFELAIEDRFASYRAPIGNWRTTVDRLSSSDAASVMAAATRYLADHFRVGETALAAWIYLKPRSEARAPSAENPTPWTFVWDGLAPPSGAPPDGVCS